MIRIFKTNNFSRWAKKEKLRDTDLKQAVDEISNGLVDANLGSGLIKKRVAKSGIGKSGGYRVLLAIQVRDRAIFMFGFLKNDRENIDTQEKEIYKKLAKYYINMPIDQLEELCKQKILQEVKNEKK